MDLSTIFGLLTSAAGVGVSMFAAINAWHAARQSAENARLSEHIIAKTEAIGSKVDGRLDAMINAIEAKALADVAVARSDAYMRVSNAFTAGQENIRKAEPVATAAAVADVASQVAAVQASVTNAAKVAKP